jgi:hypothetical protein
MFLASRDSAAVAGATNLSTRYSNWAPSGTRTQITERGDRSANGTRGAPTDGYGVHYRQHDICRAAHPTASCPWFHAHALAPLLPGSGHPFLCAASWP